MRRALFFILVISTTLTACTAVKPWERGNLAKEEMDQAEVIATYLPAQMSEEEVKKGVEEIIAQSGASSMKDMGKVMGMASSKFGGQADNKLVSTIVRSLLS